MARLLLYMSSSNRQVWQDKWHSRTEPINDFAKQLVSELGEGKSRKLLDLGCGNGMDTLYFAEQGYNVTAVDVSESGIKMLQERLDEASLPNIFAVLHDISQPLAYPSSSFDVVYAHLSLHYFDDETTRQIIQNIHQLLATNGMFFIRCKSVDDPLYGKGENEGEDMFRSDHLRHFFREEYMRSILENFEILSLDSSESSYHGKTSAFLSVVAKKN